MISKLQSLTENNSDSLAELFHSFEKKFPEEKGCITLLRDQIFNPNTTTKESEVLESLNKIKK